MLKMGLICDFLYAEWANSPTFQSTHFFHENNSTDVGNPKKLSNSINYTSSFINVYSDTYPLTSFNIIEQASCYFAWTE